MKAIEALVVERPMLSVAMSNIFTLPPLLPKYSDIKSEAVRLIVELISVAEVESILL